MKDYLVILIQLAGVGELVLVAASAFIPKALNWKEAMGNPNRLVRQLFWTYACYILACHLFFGLISVFAAEALICGGILAIALTTLMTLWWGVRILLQFFCFDRSCIPENRFNTVAEVLLVCLFFYLTAVYGWALMENLRG
ncbi:hypothetical protein SAMN02745181_2033 [Rubritalea squalenifaciens DSM 18772]|uniref:DUF4149 domain-containing protein n=1 Tax=Rubritalea squalenifaciens DSM 18772 TaxID=1123071 RepID=A0A1M6J7S9_9BACT|nr:hypothetical protein [Rubritalea squalenifaciens]SHJ42725.1 hypothetical protein SAMN02745181_2033 [Rubritalea squalenifaciens DSM 18772]